jgi:hypothetical protein
VFSRSRELASIAAKSKLKKVLVLGSGYVSAPIIDYLARQKSVSLVIGGYLSDVVMFSMGAGMCRMCVQKLPKTPLKVFGGQILSLT